MTSWFVRYDRYTMLRYQINNNHGTRKYYAFRARKVDICII